MNRKSSPLLLAAFSLCFLVACGNKGPLYQTPEQPATTPATQQPTTPATQQPTSPLLVEENI